MDKNTKMEEGIGLVLCKLKLHLIYIPNLALIRLLSKLTKKTACRSVLLRPAGGGTDPAVSQSDGVRGQKTRTWVCVGGVDQTRSPCVMLTYFIDRVKDTGPGLEP